MINYLKWSLNLAYAVGLIATDGNLSNDGRHIDLTSKDIEQLENFQKCLDIKHKVTLKTSGYSAKKYFRIQFSDAKFYRWLNGIGLTPKKSKTINSLELPDCYFFDFLRGSFDGDGCSYSYHDKRWKSSFMIYISFASASVDYLKWIESTVSRLGAISGKIKRSGTIYQLIYAKKSSIILFQKMYHSSNLISLERKRLKVEESLMENML